MPIYGALHFVPMLLFKRAAFVHAPKAMALRAGWGTLRSASFLGIFNAIYQGNVIARFRKKLLRWLLTRGGGKAITAPRRTRIVHS